jgi:pyruvate,water dikinase
MRRCALALGRKLVDRGVFERPDDVFYLYADELREVVSGTGEGGADAATAARAAEAAAAKVGERRAELVADAAIDPPETVCGDGRSGPPRRPPSTAEGLTSLFGIGGSAGVVRGRARIVHDPACDGRPLTREDVLVVPFTDIGWTPVLADAGGIVAETGGQLSHTSIIAREFGIPAVVSVRDATRLIREGQTVTVDGAAGRVFLHPEEGL